VRPDEAGEAAGPPVLDVSLLADVEVVTLLAGHLARPTGDTGGWEGALRVAHPAPEHIRRLLREAGAVAEPDLVTDFVTERGAGPCWRPVRIDETSPWVLEHWHRAAAGLSADVVHPVAVPTGSLRGLRLLLVCHEATRTGAPAVLLTLARWLVAQGVQVATLVMVPGPLTAEFAALGPVVEPVAGQLDVANLPPFDLVYGNTVVSSGVLAALARRGHPALLHAHELDQVIETVGRGRVAEGLIASRALVAVSMASEAALRRVLGPVERPIHRVTEILDPHRFAEAEAIGRHRHRAGRFTAGGFGTFCGRKGGDLLARVAGLAARRAPELGADHWAFHWVGQHGDDAAQLLAAVRDGGLPERLHFLGEHAQPLALVGAFDVLALLSREDTYPLAMCEAALVGVPTVAQRGSGGPDEFAVGGGVALVDREDPEAVLRALVLLDRHPELRTLMAAAGAAKVRRENHVDAVGPRIAVAIAECVAPERAGRIDVADRPTALVADGAPARPRVSIVIPVFNRADMTERCLRQLARTVDATTTELVVVDNGSSDGSAELVKRLWPSATVVRNDTNAGFARGCNQGVAASRADRIVLLNNDTEAAAGWLESLLGHLEDPAVGIVAPKLLFPDGTVQHAGLHVVQDHKHRLALNGSHRHYRARADLPAVDIACDLQLVSGAVMAMRRSTFDELGGFDEGYWNGCEDADLCFAATAAGYRVVYEPASVLLHHESASGPERWTRQNDNLVRLARKWAGRVEPDLVVHPDGTVVPAAGVTTADVAAHPPAPGALRVAIDGAAFAYHSLAQVNRELGVRLAGRHGMEVLARSSTMPEITAVQDPRLVPMVRTARRPAGGPPDVTIRHQWPPDWSPPADPSPVVVIQPWEFGGLPDEWVGPLAEWPDEIWCYTNWVRDCYVRSGVPADRLVVVPLGVDGERFRPDGPRYPLATRRSRRLLFVGGLIRRKGVDLLLEAYRRAFRAGDDVCLVIKAFGGDSVYRDSGGAAFVDALRRDPDVADIELITEDLNQQEIAALYRSCDALVHPYRGEGFGLPIAEAMASGLPVIVTDDGAARDFCDEHSAFLVPSRRVTLPPGTGGLGPSRAGYWQAEVDVDALAATMRTVLDDPAQAARVAAEGRARVLAQLSWDRIADLAADRLEALAARPARRLAGPDPYRPDCPPYPLDEPRARTLLVVAGPGRARWRKLVATAAAEASAADDLTLVVAVQADGATTRQRTLDELAAVLDGTGADVLAVPDADDAALAGLLVGTDAVVAADDVLRARALRCRATVLDGTEPAVRAWVRTAPATGTRMADRTKSPGQAA